MHEMLLREVVKVCRHRQEQGDCPMESALSVEVLEHAVVQLADMIAEQAKRVISAMMQPGMLRDNPDE